MGPMDDPVPAAANTGAAPRPPAPAAGPCRTGVAGKSSAQAPEVGSSGRGSGKRSKQTAAAHADHVRRRRCVVTNIDIPEVGKVAVQDRAAEDAGQSADKTGESIDRGSRGTRGRRGGPRRVR